MNEKPLNRLVKRRKAPKQNKHGNIKVEADGHKFDSKVEYRYYLKLKHLQAAGEVLSFEMQKAFIIFDGFNKNGKRYQAITYNADFFVTYANGEQVVIDVKGQDKVTADFAMKFKMFHARYPYRFIIAREIKNTKRFIEKESLR